MFTEGAPAAVVLRALDADLCERLVAARKHTIIETTGHRGLRVTHQGRLDDGRLDDSAEVERSLDLAAELASNLHDAHAAVAATSQVLDEGAPYRGAQRGTVDQDALAAQRAEVDAIEELRGQRRGGLEILYLYLILAILVLFSIAGAWIVMSS